MSQAVPRTNSSVLFVDDEPFVLEALRRMLRGLGLGWRAEFADSGASAIETLRRAPFDVVVTDLRMPGMDGLELLGEVERLSPGTVRIVLSGQAERATVLRCLGSAHQYLAKPCQPETLCNAITRAQALRTFLGGACLGGLVPEADLPALPELFSSVVRRLRDPRVSLREVGELIAQDVGMSVKVLRIVNSAYFGLRRPITDVAHAVSYLGFEAISSLVLGLEVFSGYEAGSLTGPDIDAIWRHTLRTASFARTLAETETPGTLAVDDAAMASMLHDIGRLALARRHRGRYGAVLERAAASATPISEAETELLGGSHAEVGACMAGRWGLAASVVEAIAYHPHPGRSAVTEFGPLAIVHVACGLAHEGDPGIPSPRLDESYLERLGVRDRLPAWREACRRRRRESDGCF